MSNEVVLRTLRYEHDSPKPAMAGDLMPNTFYQGEIS